MGTDSKMETAGYKSPQTRVQNSTITGYDVGISHQKNPQHGSFSLKTKYLSLKSLVLQSPHFSVASHVVVRSESSNNQTTRYSVNMKRNVTIVLFSDKASDFSLSLVKEATDLPSVATSCQFSINIQRKSRQREQRQNTLHEPNL